MKKVLLSSVVWLSPLALAWAAQSNRTDDYPTVRPSAAVFSVPNVDRADVEYLIRSDKDQPIYKLQCHHAGFRKDPDFDYSGDFECRLNSVGNADQFSTMLTEDVRQSRDWQSRGRFLAASLHAPCSQIAHFGAVRDFRLRGMILTLEIVDPQFDDATTLKSLTLRVEVRPDPSAHSPIAEAVPVPKQGVPKSCELGRYFVDSTRR
jgi:hypothetical protein